MTRIAAVGRAAAVLAMVGALVGAGAVAPASAHAQLVSSDPADGATLTAAPSTVSFTFNEELLTGSGTAISVNTTDGTVVESSEVTPDGDTISAPWPKDAVSGTFQVAYRVVSDDGHPVTGSITLTIDATVGGDSPPPSALPTSTAEEPSRGIAASLVVSLAVVLVGALVVVTVIAWRRRRA